MNYAQLVQLYFERSTALQNYWTLYVVIIGGLLAFSSMRQLPNRLTTILITVLFLSFAYKNCGAIVDVTNQRFATLEAIKAVNVGLDQTIASGIAPATPGDARIRSLLEPTMVGTDAQGVKRFHIFCDVLTVLTLWSMEWRRRRRMAELAAQQGIVIPAR
jgi:hypothetical protein